MSCRRLGRHGRNCPAHQQAQAQRPKHLPALSAEVQDFETSILHMYGMVILKGGRQSFSDFPFSYGLCGKQRVSRELPSILPESVGLRRASLNRLLAFVGRSQQFVKLPVTVQASQ